MVPSGTRSVFCAAFDAMTFNLSLEGGVGKGSPLRRSGGPPGTSGCGGGLCDVEVK